MHIEKIILSALIFGVSLPLFAEECPADSPLKGKDGVCYSCDEKDEIYLENEEDNSVCPVRALRKSEYYIISIQHSLNKCPPEKPFSYVKKMESHMVFEKKLEGKRWECEDGVICTTPAGYYYPVIYEALHRFCYSCDDQTFPFGKEICSKCPNREYVDGKCVLKKEPK